LFEHSTDVGSGSAFGVSTKKVDNATNKTLDHTNCKKIPTANKNSKSALAVNAMNVGIRIVTIMIKILIIIYFRWLSNNDKTNIGLINDNSKYKTIYFKKRFIL
jgi:hypothetical protein